MATHKIGPEIYGVVPLVMLVLKGDFRSIINFGDVIETSLVAYLADDVCYYEQTDKTMVFVKEIVS